MSSRSPRAFASARSDWPAVVVAMGILVLLGAVLVTATARWGADDVQRLLVALTPVIGVVTGAFVTYFFTRQAYASASEAAQTVIEQANRAAERATGEANRTLERVESEIQRNRVLHNALATAVSMVDQRTRQKMREDPAIRAALEQG